MESPRKSGGGSTPGAGAGAGGEGVLCHACGYQYPNGHPSAKQRRAHRKHCGKPTSTAGTAEEGAREHDGSKLLLGGGGGGAGTDGNGAGAGATECGGGSPGSAHEPGDAVDGGGDSAGAGNGAGHEVTGDKSAEDCLISSINIPSEITSEASRIDDDTLTTATVATQYSEKESPIEDGDPSDPSVDSEQLQGVPTSVVLPEPEDRAKFSSEISGNEIQNLSIVRPESDAAGGGTSELMSDVVREQDGAAMTGEGGMINTIAESKSSEGKSVQGDEPGLSCQDILRTEIGEGHNSTVVEEDSVDKNPTASNNEEILSDETESNQQSKHELTLEKVPNIEPAESSAEKFVGTNDDVLQLGKDGCHSEIADDIKAQQQPDSTSGMADHLAISKGAENIEGQHYAITDESTGAISSTFGPAVGAKVIDATGNLTEQVCSSGIPIDDSMQGNATSGTIIPSQANLLNLSPSTTQHEINMVGSINDVDGKSQNEKSSTDLASYEVKEMVSKDNFEEKQQTKEVTVDPTPHEANSFPNTDNHEENEQNEEIILDTSYKISAVQNMSSTEEKEQIEEFIANLASEEINVTSNRDMVEQQDETDVKTNHEIDGAHRAEATGENNATAGESNAGTITDVVEDKMPNEEITSGALSLNITDRSIEEEQMHNEEVNEGLGSRDDIVVHGPDYIKEKVYEETTSCPTLDKFSLLTSADSPEERKEESTSADPISHETNVAQTSDGVDEEKIREPAADPTSSIGTMGSIGDAEDKKPNEETAADPTVENTTTQGIVDAESSKKNENTIIIGDTEDKKLGQETTADPRPVENTTQGTEDAESSKQYENTTSIGDAEDKKQAEETTAVPRSVEIATIQGIEDAESSKQNEKTTTTDEAEVAQNTNAIEERETTEDTASKEISTIESTDDLKGATDQNEEIADKEMVTDSDKNHVSLKVLLADKSVETKEKEKKASTKDRVLSLRRRVSKDNVSPVKPGSPPKDGSGQQDWNSPARLPVEKKPKGRKQQWVPFICCSSVQ